MGKELKSNKLSITERLRPLVLLGLVYLSLSILLRVVLWWQFGLAEGVAPLTLPAVLALGVWQDVSVLPFVLGPLAALLCLLPAGWGERRWLRATLGSLLYLLLFGLMYLPFVEFFFFQEFDARFNLVAVDYLIYPHEVLVNIWESYPVGWVLLVVGAVALLLHRLLWPAFRRGFQSRCPVKARLRLGGIWLLLAFAAVMLPGFGARSSNRVAAELSANGLRSLVQAFCTNELSYVKYYRTMEDSQAFALMHRHFGMSEPTAAPYDLNRTAPDRANGFGPMNVVVIVEESFGAGFVGVYGDERGLTPNFDRLATESLRFGNAFATGTRTVRGLEAITLSLPSRSPVSRW